MRQTIVIKGNIQPKGRPRFARRGAYVSTYTPKATAQAEEMIRREYLVQTRQKHPYEGPVKVSMAFFYTPPKSVSKQARAEMLAGMTERTKKPDLDNLAKTVLDALNGVAWLDDKQIIMMQVCKGYSEADYAVIEVEEITQKER